jgi:hypothetical protein
MTEIAGLPFWELTYDAEGNPDPATEAALLGEVAPRGITDLVVFAHGWNNDRRVALRLYNRFFGALAGQLQHVPAGQPTQVGLAGVLWPSQRWSDEPIPDFNAPAVAGAGGAAAVSGQPADEVVMAAELDPETLAALHEVFPAATSPLDRMAALLAGPPTDDAQAEFYQELKEFAVLVGAAGDDGEDGRERPDLDPAEPGMLLDGPAELFERYADTLRETGVSLGGAGAGTGEAGFGDAFGKVWHGAKEALRQLTYWQMKNRAGTVGRKGLGPLLGRLHATAPDLRVHLVGHSFGARLVSYSLAGMPAGLDPSPVKGVTLLQGAFSQWAFARRLPFDAGHSGALAGMLDRIDGPLVAVHSRHDGAVGTFYPLASMARQDDSAGIGDASSRWGGIGSNGAQGVQARHDAVRGAGPGNRYQFATRQAMNVDASDVVRTGGPPAGAHSDIVHPELTWIVLSAGRIVS